jgi:glutaredoxin 3
MAREAYEEKGYAVTYHDVKQNPSLLTQMLEHSDGRRSVPVIVEDGRVTVGYGGT